MTSFARSDVDTSDAEVIIEETSHEPWWKWHWDRLTARGVKLPYSEIVRWRRGSFLTVYRMKMDKGGTQWWLYGPFSLCVGFGIGS